MSSLNASIALTARTDTLHVIRDSCFPLQEAPNEETR
jgi:hypothetical protein